MIKRARKCSLFVSDGLLVRELIFIEKRSVGLDSGLSVLVS